MKLYTKDHEWVEVSGQIATIGISNHAAEELGDITFVELPECDDEIAAKDSLAVIESVKAASDIYAPVSGVIVKINEILEESPELVNESAEKDGWICEIKMSNEDELKQLMSADEYKDYLN